MDPEVRRRRRRRILDKLGEVTAKLEKLLAGQDITLADIKLPQEQEPGESPLERLRRFKDLLQGALDQLHRAEPRLCARCQAPLGDPALDELPWAWACEACAAASA